MNSTTPVWVLILVAILASGASLLVAILTAYEQRKKIAAELDFQRRKFEQELTARNAEADFQRRKFEQELSAQRERMQAEHATELSVEKALHDMLSIYELPYRSFQMIRHHIGGFDANELRRLLVRAGAVRFMAADGTEMWALISKVESEFKYGHWRLTDSPQNKVSAIELFPGALNESTEF